MTSINGACYQFSKTDHWLMTSVRYLAHDENQLTTSSKFQLSVPESVDIESVGIESVDIGPVNVEPVNVEPPIFNDAKQIACARNGDIYALKVDDKNITIVKRGNKSCIKLPLEQLKERANNEEIVVPSTIIHMVVENEYVWLVITNINKDLVDENNNNSRDRLHDYFIDYIVAIKNVPNCECCKGESNSSEDASNGGSTEESTNNECNCESPVFGEIKFNKELKGNNRDTYKVRYLSLDIDDNNQTWLFANTSITVNNITLGDEKLTTDKASTLFKLTGEIVENTDIGGTDTGSGTNNNKINIDVLIHTEWNNAYENADFNIDINENCAWLVTKPYGNLPLNEKPYWQIERLTLGSSYTTTDIVHQSELINTFSLKITTLVPGYLVLWNPPVNALDIYQQTPLPNNTLQFHNSVSLQSIGSDKLIGDIQLIKSEKVKVLIANQSELQYIENNTAISHSQRDKIPTLITRQLTSPDQGSVSGWLVAEIDVDFNGDSQIEVSVASQTQPFKRDVCQQLDHYEYLSWSSVIDQMEKELPWKQSLTRTYNAKQWAQQKIIFPLHNISDKFLWLRIRIVNHDKNDHIVLREIKITYPERSLIEYLPAIYQENESSVKSLRNFMTMFDYMFSDLRKSINNIPNTLAEPKTDEWRAFITRWFGLPAASELSEIQQSQLVVQASEILQLQGTLRGLQKILDIITEKKALAIDKAQNSIFYPVSIEEGASILILVDIEKLSNGQNLVLQRYLVDYLPVTTDYEIVKPIEKYNPATPSTIATASVAFYLYCLNLPIPNIESKSSTDDEILLDKLHHIRAYFDNTLIEEKLALVNLITSYIVGDITSLPEKKLSFIVEHVGQFNAVLTAGYEVEIKIDKSKEVNVDVIELLPWFKKLLRLFIPKSFRYRVSFITNLADREIALENELGVEFPVLPFPEIILGEVKLPEDEAPETDTSGTGESEADSPSNTEPPETKPNGD